MRDVIYVKMDIVYSINQQVNETISQKILFFFETVKSKVIISLFESYGTCQCTKNVFWPLVPLLFGIS